MRFKASYFFSFSIISFILFSCSKEIKIDIPEYQTQLVVDGRIETGGFPIVILTESQNLYEPTNLGTFVQSNIFDAEVSICIGVDTTTLTVFNPLDLPYESQITLAEMLEIELDELQFFPIKVYSTIDESLRGVEGNTYQLQIQSKGSYYQANTTLLHPISLQETQWIPDTENPNFGMCRAFLNDPIANRNSYRWETKNITLLNGIPKDNRFRHNPGSFFSDKYFNGIPISFDTKYPEKDTSYPSGYKKHFKLNDQIVIKFSSIEYSVFDYYDKRLAQMDNSGSPFSTPINIPSNINNHALGIWAGYSTWFDTLQCIP